MPKDKAAVVVELKGELLTTLRIICTCTPVSQRSWGSRFGKKRHGTAVHRGLTGKRSEERLELESFSCMGLETSQPILIKTLLLYGKKSMCTVVMTLSYAASGHKSVVRASVH